MIVHDFSIVYYYWKIHWLVDVSSQKTIIRQIKIRKKSIAISYINILYM